MNKVLLEICCGSADDVLEAYRGGADRVELNSCLFFGGLTPSVGELTVVKRRVPIPVMTMVRPRQGGFCYTQAEYETALADAQALLERGSDGLVFGFLKEDGSLDEGRCAQLVKLCKEAGKEAVFHRAIDVAQDWRDMLSRLIDLGVDRVLTSGQAPDVSYGTDTVREMIQFAAGRIQILPGAGINAKNIRRVLEQTGATQLHLARHTARTDKSTLNNRDIFYGGCLYPSETTYDVTDGDYIAGLRGQLM